MVLNLMLLIVDEKRREIITFQTLLNLVSPKTEFSNRMDLAFAFGTYEFGNEKKDVLRKKFSA